MPNIGKKSGGASKSAGKIKPSKKSPSMKVSLGGKGKPTKAKGKQSLLDDAPIFPGMDAEEINESEVVSEVRVSPAEPFSDGLVSSKLKGLTVVARVGGQEVSVLHDFLELFAKTDTFIGTISSKTSFMKKTGGRLL